MTPSLCLRRLSQLSLDNVSHVPIAPRSLLSAPQTSYFSTSAARYANPQQKKKGMVAAPKRGTKTLNVKKGRSAAGGSSGKKPAPGERKAMRKRIVLSNTNALEVPYLEELSKENVLSDNVEGKVLALPDDVVDSLRAVEAFKVPQGWRYFRKPAVLVRKETMEVAQWVKDVEGAEGGQQKKTIRKALIGEKLSGKSTLLLQAMTMAFLRGWVVINLPEGQDITIGHTEYAPLPGSSPTQYTQDTYAANLLAQISRANGPVLGELPVTTNPTLPIPLPANSTLKDLAALGAANSEASWPIFVALWNELTQPGRPPIMLAADGLAHIMKNSEYFSADVQPIHAFDLTLIRHFVDHLSGASSLPNGGIVLGSTSGSNTPAVPALDFSMQVAEAKRYRPENLPRWNPYVNVDQRVMECLKNLEVLKVSGLSKEEARAIMEYYAASGMLRAAVNDGFVAEKWSLAGMGNIGELERASVRMRL